MVYIVKIIKRLANVKTEKSMLCDSKKHKNVILQPDDDGNWFWKKI